MTSSDSKPPSVFVLLAAAAAALAYAVSSGIAHRTAERLTQLVNSLPPGALLNFSVGLTLLALAVCILLFRLVKVLCR